jgi:hypothetical protein
MGPQCEQVRTDGQGRFVFASVVAGDVPVVARSPARTLASWQGSVKVTAGHREELTIHLEAGATLSGTVRNGAGGPLAKVELSAGEWDTMSNRSARSAEDGSYRLEGLSAGKLHAQAADDKVGKLSADFELAAGEQRRWDPVLSAGLQVRGRTVDADGKPVGQVMVEANLERWVEGDHWWGWANSDADGRFELNNCVEGRSMRIMFRRNMFPEVTLEGVLPQATELVVTMPKPAWIYIEGTVLGPGGEVLPNVHASPYLKDSMSGTPAETADAKTGAFRYGPYPPGIYSLTLSADGYPEMRLGERNVAPDEVWNLGTLHFQRGGIVVVHLLGEITVPDQMDAVVYGADGTWLARFEIQNGTGRSAPLVPGSYTLQIAGESLASTSIPFEIQADRESKLDVPLQKGVQATFECTVPAGTQAPRYASIVVRDAARTLVWRGQAWKGDDGTMRAKATLRPGTWSVEAEAAPLRANGTITVGAEPVVLELVLRQP